MRKAIFREGIKKLLKKVGYGEVTHLFDFAIDRAEKLVTEYADIIDKILEMYRKHRIASIADEKFLGWVFSQQNRGATFFTLAKISNAYSSLWANLRDKRMHFLYENCELQKYEKNSLALLLNPDDQKFLDAVERGVLPLGEEVGLIALQRLKEIAITAPHKKMKAQANQCIKMAMQPGKDGIYYFDFQALVFEVTKLLLYSQMKPQKQVIYLGTARTVDAVMKKNMMEEGIGLGCPEAQYSWGLNRAWLQFAAIMGYSFQLVEQHFPSVQEAFCMGQPLLLIEALAKQIRQQTTSQYARSDSPTATPQEALSLMGVGYVGTQNLVTGILFLVRHDAASPKYTRAYCGKPGRPHSAPIDYGMFPPPPPISIAESVIAPLDGSSSEHRNSPIMDWDSMPLPS